MKTVKEILAEQLLMDEHDIKNSLKLKEDLEVDSLDIVEIWITIESEYDIELLDEELYKVTTVQDLIDLVGSKIPGESKEVVEINKMNLKTISLPRLNNLNPTIESTVIKLMEEAGELAQHIGKHRGLSGEQGQNENEALIEKIADELLDVAQVAISLMFVLEEQYDVDIERKVQEHIAKLKSKGYIK